MALQDFTQSLKEVAFGQPGQFKQVPIFGQNQVGAMNQLLNYSLPQLTSNQFEFGPIAENARKQFFDRSLPGLKQSLSNLGGTAGSSGYRGAITSAAADLESQLAALQSNYNLQRQSQLQGLLGLGLTPQFETAFQSPEPGAIHAAAEPIAKAVGENFVAPIVHAGAEKLANKLFGPKEVQEAVQSPTKGQELLEQTGKAAASGAATGAGSAAGATLVPAAAKAIAAGGLTPIGQAALILGAVAAVGAGGYYLWKKLRGGKEGWEKQRDLNAQERARWEEIAKLPPEQQKALGIIPVGAPSNYAQQKALGYIR